MSVMIKQTVRMDPETYAKVSAAAKAKSMAVSAYIRHVLRVKLIADEVIEKVEKDEQNAELLKIVQSNP